MSTLIHVMIIVHHTSFISTTCREEDVNSHCQKQCRWPRPDRPEDAATGPSTVRLPDSPLLSQMPPTRGTKLQLLSDTLW